MYSIMRRRCFSKCRYSFHSYTHMLIANRKKWDAKMKRQIQQQTVQKYFIAQIIAMGLGYKFSQS